MDYFLHFQVEFIHMQSTVFCSMINSQSYCAQLLSFKVIFIISSGTQHVMTRDIMLYQSASYPVSSM